MKRKLSVLALLAAISMPAWAGECEVTIEGNDALQFNLKSIVVPKACDRFNVTLEHTGKLGRQVMGHNFVLGLTADQMAINADGMQAGAASDYVKADDPRVIAASKLIGGGESTTVEIPVGKLEAGASYTYFCSFPGHAAVMKGTLELGG